MFKGILIVIIASVIPQIKSEFIKKYADFSLGLLNGFDFKIDFPNGEECEQSVEKLIQNIQEIHDVENFFVIMNDFFSHSIHCFDMKEEYSKFVEHLNLIFSADQIQNTLLQAFFKSELLMNDYKEAIEKYFQIFRMKSGDYYQAGKDFGDIIKMVIHPKPKKQQMIDSAVEQLNRYVSFLSDIPVTPSKCSNSPSAQDLIDVNSFSYSTLPKKGVSSDINIEGTMKEYQDIQKVTIKTFLSGIKMDSRDQPAVASLDKGEKFTFKYGCLIPGIAPAGLYQVQFEVVNVEQKVIQCWQIELNL